MVKNIRNALIDQTKWYIKNSYSTFSGKTIYRSVCGQDFLYTFHFNHPDKKVVFTTQNDHFEISANGLRNYLQVFRPGSITSRVFVGDNPMAQWNNKINTLEISLDTLDKIYDKFLLKEKEYERNKNMSVLTWKVAEEDKDSLESKIPQEWIDSVEKIRKEFGTKAFIAGGCLRDLDNDKPISDVDIFIRGFGVPDKVMNEKGFAQHIRDRKIKLEKMFGDYAEVENTGSCYTTKNSIDHMDKDKRHGLEECWRVRVYNTYPKYKDQSGNKMLWEYNLIFWRYLDDYVDGVVDLFDLGLCMIGLQEDGTVYRSEKYIDDKENKTITVDLPKVTIDKYLDKFQDHIQRMKRKYPDFTIVYPTEEEMELVSEYDFLKWYWETTDMDKEVYNQVKDEWGQDIPNSLQIKEYEE